MAKGKEVPESIPVIEVSWQQAEQWLLTRYEDQRALRDEKVRTFARDMSAKPTKWIFNGDPVRFASDGRLVDGQHRLRAQVLSRTTQWWPVVNIPDEAHPTIDTGTARTLHDVLQMGGHILGREGAAIVTRVVIYQASRRSPEGANARIRPSHTESIAFVEANRKKVERAAWVARQLHRNPLPVPPSPVGAAYYLCAEIHTGEAEEFFVTQLILGRELKEGSPAGAYRNRAIRHHKNNSRTMHASETFAFALQAWNHWRDGKKLDRLMPPKVGWNKDNLPTPR